MRLLSVRGRVRRLRQKHEIAASAAETISMLRQRPTMAQGGLGWSGFSLPTDLKSLVQGRPSHDE